MHRSFLFVFGRKESMKEGGQRDRGRHNDLNFKKSAKRSTAISLCAGQAASKAAPEMDAQHTDHYKQQ
jgi:hypothetical protein